jgi:predicted nucleic acid-binding protein
MSAPWVIDTAVVVPGLLTADGDAPTARILVTGDRTLLDASSATVPVLAPRAFVERSSVE